MIKVLFQLLKNSIFKDEINVKPVQQQGKRQSLGQQNNVKQINIKNTRSSSAKESQSQMKISNRNFKKQKKQYKTGNNQIQTCLPQQMSQIYQNKKVDTFDNTISQISYVKSDETNDTLLMIEQADNNLQQNKNENFHTSKFQSYNFIEHLCQQPFVQEQAFVQGTYYKKVYKSFQVNHKDFVQSMLKYNSTKKQIRFEYQLNIQGEPFTIKKSQDFQNYQILEDIEKQMPEIIPFLIYQFQQQSKPSQTQLKHTQKYVLQNIKYLNQFNPQVYATQLCIPLILLKQQIQTQHDKRVTFQDFQDINTALSIKDICGKPYQNLIKFRYKIQQNDIFNFQHFINPKNKKRLDEFIQNQLSKLSDIFNVPKSQVYIFKLSKGSIIIDGAIVTDKYQELLSMNCGFTRLFNEYRLSQSCFVKQLNSKFQKQWRCQGNYLQKRGGFPYYPPVLCQRFALNVIKKFRDDQWLSCLSSNKKQWAVGMHGSNIHARSEIKKQNNKHSQKQQNTLKKSQIVIQSMLKGFQNNNMLLPGKNQIHSGFINARKIQSGQKIGRGVYFTPYYESALAYSKLRSLIQQQNQQNIIKSRNNYCKRLNTVIQCRIHPDKIQISPQPQSNHIWIVNKSQYIRPYGILISLKKDYQQSFDYLAKIRNLKVPNYDTYLKTFIFNYNQWKDEIQEYCKSFQLIMENNDEKDQSNIRIQ